MDYIVKQGDHLPRVAQAHGFTDWTPIWLHDANRALRDARKSPNVLHPGDKLVIPERESKQIEAATEQRHTFKAKTTSLKLVLALQDTFGRPLADTECLLTIDGEVFKLTTDGKGKLEHPIRQDVTDARLTLVKDHTALGGTEIRLSIGHLDPVSEPSGQAARLRNLGYLGSPGEVADAEKSFGFALEEFQCDHGLTVDGVCGTKTQAKLKEVYGC